MNRQTHTPATQDALDAEHGGVQAGTLSFEREVHSFVKSENILRVPDVEQVFYARVFRISVSEPVESADTE
jgi:hypothetical protein